MNIEKKIYEDYFVKQNTISILRYKWFTRKYFHNVKNKRILEIGCGDGGVIQLLKESNEVHALDISKSSIALLKQKGIYCHLHDISTEKLPFDDGFFDYIIILEVMEHLKSPQFAIEEFQRVLKLDGALIVSVPNPRTLHKFIYPALFTFKGFKKYLSNNGFYIKETSTYGICLPFWSILRSVLNKEYKGQKLITNEKKEEAPFFSKVVRLLSSDIVTLVKPKILGWSFIYFCINENPRGAKDLYKEIADETKVAYE